jgi:hypothetical protein
MTCPVVAILYFSVRVLNEAHEAWDRDFFLECAVRSSEQEFSLRFPGVTWRVFSCS